MGRWIIPDDWIEENDGYTTVVFCIPNSRQWRGLITAHLDDLTYGRHWSEKTGSILGVLDIAREVFASMTICDLQVELDRIATATETMADNQPKLYTLAELATVFEDNPTINFEQIEAFLNVFGLLPSIKFDPLKYILEWIWRAQMLNNTYAQSTSQAAIAGALAKGLAIDGIEAVLETADDVTDLIFQILQGGGTLAAGVAAIATLFKDTEEGSAVKVLQDVIVNLADVTVTVDNTIECGSCGGGGCSNCREGGAAFSPTGLEPSECEPPLGFSSWGDYSVYKCRAVNRIIDDYLIIVRELSQTYTWFLADMRGSGDRLTPISTLNRISNFLPASMPDAIERNLTPTTISQIKAEMNERYRVFYDANDAENWVDSAPWIRKYWGVFDDLVTVLETDAETRKQSLFNDLAQPALFQDLYDYIGDEIDDILIADPTLLLTDEAKTSLQTMLTTGFTNIPFFNSSFAMNYSPIYACTGQMGCCVEVWLTVGTWDGTLYSSEFNGVHHEVAMWLNVDDPTFSGGCGALLMPRALVVNGFTPLGSGDSVQLFQTAVIKDWEEDALILESTFGSFCGMFYRVRSTTAFSFDMDSLRDECI